LDDDHRADQRLKLQDPNGWSGVTSRLLSGPAVPFCRYSWAGRRGWRRRTYPPTSPRSRSSSRTAWTAPTRGHSSRSSRKWLWSSHPICPSFTKGKACMAGSGPADSRCRVRRQWSRSAVPSDPNARLGSWRGCRSHRGGIGVIVIDRM